MKGKLIKGVGGKYFVNSNGKIYECVALKKIKQTHKLIIGDEVEFLKQDDAYFIQKIYQRKNSLIRPKVSNVDLLCLIIAPLPKPDFVLIDKMLIFAKLNNLQTLLIVNKTDLADKTFIEKIKQQYKNAVNNIVFISAKNNENIETLKKYLKNKFSVFAGASAVGKSTILNTLNSNLKLETGQLSKKVNRGKHTTRHSEIFEIEKDTFVADTPGFSLLVLKQFELHKLENHYEEFKPYNSQCKYRTCTHIFEKEKECGVKQAVNNGKINKERYNRYVEIYKQLKKDWENKYD